MKNRGRLLLHALALSGLGLALPTPAVAQPPEGAAAARPWREVAEATLGGGEPQRRVAGGRQHVVGVDQGTLLALLAGAPLEETEEARARAVVLDLPWPDGGYRAFRVERSPIMEAPLASAFPDIRTWRAQGVDEPAATARLDWTERGLHALVLSAAGRVFLDPWAPGDTAHYVSYFARDYRRASGPPPFECLAGHRLAAPQEALQPPNGSLRRTYRLAVAATGEYTAFYGGTVAGAMAGIVTTVNRVDTVYERDLAVRLVLVANNELVVYTDPATDPYSNGNASAMLSQNQSNLNAVIGSANYDIGHVFATAGSGLAGLGVVCTSSKARGVTGRASPLGDSYDIDYVAHEMGHQFDGSHTFNGTTGSCGGGNRSSDSAYEPGSGSTVMAYAGICGAEDLQPHSDAVFHAGSQTEMVGFVVATSCDVETATGNTPPVVDAGPAYTVPKRTPFTLTATATDADGDALTYAWEEHDLGPAAPPNSDADGQARPLFRSYEPSASPSRTFPRLPDILSGTETIGEVLPSITRTLHLVVTARDNRAGSGGTSVDETTVSVRGEAGPFQVTAPVSVVLRGGSATTVTWDVAGTTAAPISTSEVRISLSTDGGTSFPFVLLAATPNDGSAEVVLPALTTASARVKVEAVGNVYFDISNPGFSIVAPGVSDLSGDGKADLVWRKASTGENAVWLMDGAGVVSAATLGPLGGAWTLAGAGDVDGDGQADLVWRNGTTGENAVWFMDGTAVASGAFLPSLPAPWAPAAVRDLDADGRADLVWRHGGSGENAAWLLNGATVAAAANLPPLPLDWSLAGAGDLDADGRADLVWRHAGTGQNAVWLMGGTAVLGAAYLPSVADAWALAEVADLDGDGRADLLWRDAASGADAAWLMAGATVAAGSLLPSVAPPWQLAGAGDLDGNGRADVLWRNGSTGENAAWFMSGLAIGQAALLSTVSDVGWAVVAP